MIRVLHVIPDGSLGGGNINVGRLARSLAGAVDCFFLMPSDSVEAVVSLFPEEKTHFGSYRGKGSPVTIAHAIVKAAPGFDIIHAQGTRAAMSLMLAKPFIGAQKTVYTVRGYHGLQNPDRLRLKIWIERLIGRSMHRVVHVSQADRDIGLAHSAFGGNASTIPNGIEAPLEPAVERDIDVLFLGRLVHQKDPITFAEMVGRLPEDLSVAMAGDGDLGDEVRRRLATTGRNVNLLGALDHGSAMRIMARARIMVMTSRWEGLPTTAIEAAMLGAAIYGIRIPPLAEVLGDTAEATLVETRDAADLARLVTEALRQGRCEKVARRQQAWVRDRYAADRMGRSYKALYEDLLEERRA